MFLPPFFCPFLCRDWGSWICVCPNDVSQDCGCVWKDKFISFEKQVEFPPHLLLRSTDDLRFSALRLRLLLKMQIYSSPLISHKFLPGITLNRRATFFRTCRFLSAASAISIQLSPFIHQTEYLDSLLLSLLFLPGEGDFSLLELRLKMTTLDFFSSEKNRKLTINKKKNYLDFFLSGAGEWFL